MVRKTPKFQASDLQGRKDFPLIPELLEKLRHVGTERSISFGTMAGVSDDGRR